MANKNGAGVKTADIQRPPAEILYADELKKLVEGDTGKPKPGGWQMTPKSVLQFVLGDESSKLKPKFVGKKAFLERCIVALATNRGLMLIGEPGTAKSYLSELLAAAISGDSTLTIQGSAGTTEDNIKYSWNYALLLAEGPTEKSLVAAPLYRAMRDGKLVRFEEITRCPLEVQDTLLSIMSERVMAVSELPDESRMLFGKVGFNLIATANTRDRGVNEMSAALKRRFNFETVQPIPDLKDEMDLVQRETTKMFVSSGIPLSLPTDIVEILATTFWELRAGKTVDCQALESLSTVMSTAEAISTGYAAGLHAYYYDDGKVTPDHIVNGLVGSAMKDSPEDLKKLHHYFNHSIKNRTGNTWQSYFEARKSLL